MESPNPMSSRPIGRHAKLSEGGSGGKFNNVDGVIRDYQFTLIHPFAKRVSNSAFKPLYAVLTAMMDGGLIDDVDVMLVGSATDFVISDNGHTLTPSRPDGTMWAKSQWGKFIASLEKSGCATENSACADNVFNYEPIIGHRVHFVQVQQFDKTGKLKTRQGTDRNGQTRMYDDTTTVVIADHGVVALTSKDNGSEALLATGSSSLLSGMLDYTRADEALVQLLVKFGGSAPKAKLASAAAQLLLKKNFAAEADTLRKMLQDDNYLCSAVDRGVIARYAQTEAEQTVTAE